MDIKLKDFDRVLKEENNRVVMEDIKGKIKMAQRKAQEYDEIFEPEKLHNVADIIVENRLLIDRVDAILGKQEKSNIYEQPSRTEEGLSILETGRGNKSALT